jgi:5-methylcytosine-specific restriction protein A
MVNVFKVLKDRVQGKAPKGAKRSPDWSKIRKAHLKAHHRCAVCESTSKLEVHHVVPFHIAPDQELNPDNLITLCENKKYGINCHQLIGHLGNYKRINPSVEIDAMMWNKKLKPE